MDRRSRIEERSTSFPLQLLFATTLALAAASPALAVDGVIEINQTRALAGGVTPGDTAGFPVTISAQGAYRLTSNLSPSGAAANVVEIDVDGVDLDLNGFIVSGANTCTQTGVVPNTVTCTGAGFAAIGITGTATQSVRIRNGTISGTIGAAIDLPSTGFVKLQDVIIGNAGGTCVTAGIVAEVMDSRIGLCGGGAISVGIFSSVVNSRGGSSNSVGISADLSSIISGSHASFGALDGITCAGSCVVEGNVVTFNGGDGIDVTAGNGSVVTDNVSSSNMGHGASLSSGSSYGQNVFQANGAGTVTGGVSRGDSACNGVAC